MFRKQNENKIMKERMIKIKYKCLMHINLQKLTLSISSQSPSFNDFTSIPSIHSNWPLACAFIPSSSNRVFKESNLSFNSPETKKIMNGVYKLFFNFIRKSFDFLKFHSNLELQRDKL